MRSAAVAIGLLLLALGGVLLLAPTLGFTSVVSDRGVSVQTAETPNALLGMDQLDVVVDDQNTPEEIIQIDNNANQDLALDVDVTINGDGLVQEEDFAEQVLAGESTTYAVSCEPGSGSGSTVVDVTVTAIGTGITISGVEESYTIERDCPGPPGGGGPPGGDAPDAEDVYDIRQESWTGDREFIFELNTDDYNMESADWDFGDGTTGEWYTQHTYAEDGTYEISLTVVIDGEEYTYTDTVVVEEQQPGDDGPPAEEVFDIRQEGWTGERGYIFEIVYDGGAENPEWDFGDGTQAASYWEQHTYAEDGEYEVTLTVTLDGERYVYTDTVSVGG